MLTFAALQMPPNQRHHQRPVLRLLMSMSQPDTASPCFPLLHLPPSSCLACLRLFQPSNCCWAKRGAILSDSIKTNALLVSRLAYYEPPSCTPRFPCFPCLAPALSLPLPPLYRLRCSSPPFCFDKQPL